MKILILFLMGLMSCFSYAANTITQIDIDSQNKMSTSSAMISDDDLDDWADNFRESFGFADNNISPDGKFFVYASSPISVNKSDPQYGNALISAFDETMTKIQKNYVMTLFGKNITDKVRSFYLDESTNNSEINLPKAGSPNFFNKLFTVLGKKLDLKEKQLDEELIDAGVDPESLRTMPQTKKKDIFRNSLIKTNLAKASGSMAGLVVVKTALAHGSDGQSYIGVIAISSPKTKQIAKDINLNRESFITGKGTEIKNLIPKNKQDFINNFGTRLVYNENGKPNIISYGISSYVPSKNTYINANLKQRAKQSAQNNADGQIAELVNGYMSVRNEDKSGFENKQFAERELVPNSDTLIKEVNTIVQTMSEKIKSHASVKLQGVSTIKNWSWTDKVGHKFVGSIRVWSYDNVMAVKNLKEGKFSHKRKTLESTDEFNESQTINTIYDF
jgi:hypothetical protein